MSSPEPRNAEPVHSTRFRVDAPPSDLEPPRRLGDYLLLERLARGGMGEVWLARQAPVSGIDKFCVVKIIRPHLTSNREYNARFVDEARIVVQLSHRNICQVFDIGLVADQYYLAMELVPGYDFRTLFERAATSGTLVDERVALHLLCEVLEALDYAHRLADIATGEPLHLVHRDVSLHNALVNLEGEVKLIDFGLAQSTLKLERTEPGVVLGKLAYMAPEHARGDRVDNRADQFSAAVVGIELLSGERFHGAMTQDEIWRDAGRGTWRPPQLSAVFAPVRAILEKALDLDPEQRHASCGVMRRALLEVQGARGVVCGTDEVRALLHRLVPDAREVHRVRMMKAAAAARASLVRAVDESTRIASRPSRLDERTAVNVDVRTTTEAGRTVLSVDPSRDAPGADATARLSSPEPTMLVRREGPLVRPRTLDRRAVLALSAAAIAITAVALWPRQPDDDAAREVVEVQLSPPVLAVASPTDPPAPSFKPQPAPTVSSRAPPAPGFEAAQDRARDTIVDAATRSPKNRRAPPATSRGKSASAVEPAQRSTTGSQSAPARPLLPARPPRSILDLIRALELSCSDRVACAADLRAKWARANEAQSLEGTKSVRDAAERCFAACKRAAP